jgi:hypothetical protein
MKKIILTLGVFALAVSVSFAKDDKKTKVKVKKAVPTAAATEALPAAKADVAAASIAAAPAATQNPDAMKFEAEVHDFGTLPEGPNAEYEFKFKNTGKEPIIIERAQPSCGCTTPSWSKDPVLPGKTGTIKASYGTQGRPNAFTKTITVYSNVGTKVLTIKGNVEKAPETSVPENNSMIKTH